MKVNIHGLGYVGCVSAACLAKAGFDVVGIDIDELKVDMVNRGRSPIVEPGLEEVVREGVRAGRLRACRSSSQPADLSLVCVGTPSRENGSLDLQYVEKVAEGIGRQLAGSCPYHVVVIRSTVLPGTVQEVVIPLLERSSGKRAGKEFGVCMNPEFLREGSSLRDYYAPPYTVIGQLDERSGDLASQLYRSLDAPVIRTGIREAEMLKYASNCFHALKVCFANEIGNLCKRLGVDSQALMDILCLDRKLNISACYLKPGFAFGGSCLPKDLRALLYRSRLVDLETPLLSSILVSNHCQVEQAFQLIRRSGHRRVGVLGLSFKAGTDDLRESPIVELIERLIGKGCTVSIFDREVSFARLHGANRRYIETVIPHISSLLKRSVQEVVDGSDLIVIANGGDGFDGVLSRLGGNKKVIDLVRVNAEKGAAKQAYEGICW